METEGRPEEERTSDKDFYRVSMFATLMYNKWQKGRSEHGTTFKIDPIEEAKLEFIDIANYAMEGHDRLCRLQERIKAIEGDMLS